MCFDFNICSLFNLKFGQSAVVPRRQTEMSKFFIGSSLSHNWIPVIPPTAPGPAKPCSRYLIHRDRNKMAVFCRRHFQIHFREWNFFVFRWRLYSFTQAQFTVGHFEPFLYGLSMFRIWKTPNAWLQSSVKIWSKSYRRRPHLYWIWSSPVIGNTAITLFIFIWSLQNFAQTWKMIRYNKYVISRRN